MKLTNEAEQYEPRQSFLFANDEMKAATEAAEASGQYTAERLKELDPAKYSAIVELRGYDWAEKRICEFLKVHHRTVAAVSDAEPEAIDAFRQRLVRKLRRGADRLVDRSVEHPDSIKIDMAGLVAAQLIDRAELLDGRATARVEHVEKVDIFGDWESFLQERLEPEEKQANAVEVGSRMGSIAGKKAPIELEDRQLAIPVPAARSDERSEVRRTVAQERAPDVTTNDPIRVPSIMRRRLPSAWESLGTS